MSGQAAQNRRYPADRRAICKGRNGYHLKLALHKNRIIPEGGTVTAGARTEGKQ